MTSKPAIVPLTPDEDAFYKAVVFEYCDFIVDNGMGRIREDPVIQAVTEGHGGSSCGFLLHFLAYVVGIRERWVNRNNVNTYRQQMNLSLLFGALWNSQGPKCVKRYQRGQMPQASHFVLMEDPTQPNDDHVCVCAKDFDGKIFLSYDLGQRGAPAEKPGLSTHRDARFCERPLALDANGLWETKPNSAIGKQLVAYLDVGELVAEARANNALDSAMTMNYWRVLAGL
jgi:hypothetical protein